MSIMNTIRKKLPKGCTTTRCNKEGCSVPLGQMMQDSILIDMDKYVPRSKRNEIRCDYLLINHPRGGKNTATLIVPMELKKGGVNIGRIARQIQAGADHADSIVPKVNKLRFTPTAFYGGRLRRRVLMDSRKPAYRISFRGEKVTILLAECGTPLEKVLKSKP